MTTRIEKTTAMNEPGSEGIVNGYSIGGERMIIVINGIVMNTSGSSEEDERDVDVGENMNV